MSLIQTSSSLVTGKSDSIPPSELQILSQEIDDKEGRYRIQGEDRIYYLIIPLLPTPVYDDETLSKPHLLIPSLPRFPKGEWTLMRLHKGPAGAIDLELSYDRLRQVENLWHARSIDVLSLKRISYHKSRVDRVEFEGSLTLSKIAIFEWWIPQVDYETMIYNLITHEQDPNEPPLAPTFLGHVTENGRPVGFLMEYIDGRYPTLDELPACEAALTRLHQLGVIHGDANRFNFLIERSTGHVKMIDFEHAERYDEDKAQQEINDLRRQFTEETGRGGAVITVNGKSIVDPRPISFGDGFGKMQS